MDFIAEEELCQQAYEVWLHYACPACDGSAPQVRPQAVAQVTSGCDGPCSVLPLVFFSASTLDGSRAGPTRRLSRQ